MLKNIIEKGFFKGLQQKVGKEKAKEAHKLFLQFWKRIRVGQQINLLNSTSFSPQWFLLRTEY